MALPAQSRPPRSTAKKILTAATNAPISTLRMICTVLRSPWMTPPRMKRRREHHPDWSPAGRGGSRQSRTAARAAGNLIAPLVIVMHPKGKATQRAHQLKYQGKTKYAEHRLGRPTTAVSYVLATAGASMIGSGGCHVIVKIAGFGNARGLQGLPTPDQNNATADPRAA